MPPSATAGFARVNGAKLYYESLGTGRPLVLLHAGIATHAMWNEQVAPFAEHHRVIRYDQRGFGRSTMPAGAYSDREDVYKLLRWLGLEQAHLIGVSLGGRLAVDFALEHPEMVASLVVVATGPGGRTPDATLTQRWAAVDAAAEAGDTAQAIELELQMWVDGPHRTPEQVDPMVREQVREMETQNFATSTDQGTLIPFDPPAVGRLGEIRAPTLVVVGDLDAPYVLAGATMLAEGITGAQKVVIPGAAHMVTMEQPDVFNRLVLDFLRAVDED